MRPEVLDPVDSKLLETRVAAETCPNCGANFVGVYCHGCGEKPLSHQDLTVKHFVIHTVVREFTDLNGSIFQTLKLLVVKPGFLAREYFSGRKSKYISPLRLYLTLSLLFFFATSFAPETNVSIQGLAKSEPTGFLRQVVEEKAKTVNFESEAVKQKIHDKFETVNALFGLTQILFIGLAFMVVYRVSRRYYVEHLILALHFASFFVIVLTALTVVGIAFIKVSAYVNFSETVRHIMSRGIRFWVPLAVLSPYLFFAFRTFYKSSIRRALIGIPVALLVSVAAQNILSWIAVLLVVVSI